ncbi:MAG: hypothetical protein R2779_04530 [Crocinitomicaceae bacterium]
MIGIRLAWIEVKAPNGDWMGKLFVTLRLMVFLVLQSIDLMDFASILQGKVEFRMYIET